VRLRTLTEAECYARCYGGHDERVTIVRRPARQRLTPRIGGEELRERFEQRLDARGPEAEAA
jgi:hypothetical protein